MIQLKNQTHREWLNVFHVIPLLMIALTSAAGAPVETILGIENFEAETPPAGCAPSAGSEVVVTPERFKSGERSLRWTWSKPDSSLTICSPTGTPAANPNQCLAFWLYNEKPLKDILYMELLSDGRSVGACWYALNFSGWRPLGAPYANRFIEPGHFKANPEHPESEPFQAVKLPPGVKINGIRFTSPPNSQSGRLYFDYVNFNCSDPLNPDHQQPWVEKRNGPQNAFKQPWVAIPEALTSPTPWRFIYSNDDIAYNRPWLPKRMDAEDITEREHADMTTLVERLTAGQAKPRAPSPIARFRVPPDDDPTILDDFQKLRIRRTPDGILTGRPIIPPNCWCAWSFNKPSDGVVLTDSDAVRHTPIMRRLVGAYLFAKNKGDRERADSLKQAFFDLCDHLLDQGFAPGNGNISINGFSVQPIITMREELAETGRLSKLLRACAACSLWFNGEVMTLKDVAKSGYNARNTDLYHDYTTLLILTALLPESAERSQRLRAYQRMLGLLCDPALGEPFAWDGTVHHHPLFHAAYGWYGGPVLIYQAFLLRDTCFQAGPEAVNMLKRAFMALSFIAAPSRGLPPNVPGYTGQPLMMPMDRITKMVMALNTAESRDGMDPDAAGVYLTMSRDFPSDAKVPDPCSDAIRGAGIKPYNFSGHLTLNGGPMAFHRRDGWLVSLAGEYKFRRNHESNLVYVASAFNHNSRNGSVFVVSSGDPVSPWASGFSLEGWDHRLIPGATSYLVKNQEQLFRRGSAASNVFCCGADLDGDGVWGLDFKHENKRFADNMSFHRSAFCFGDRVTLITSDIDRGPAAGMEEKTTPFVTTLFQNVFGSGGETELTDKGKGRFGLNPPKRSPAPPGQEPCWIGNRKVTDFPFEEVLTSGTERCVVDNKRTGYYIHAEAPPLRVTRREQQWTYINNPVFPHKHEPTKGEFNTAWFEHGAKPEFTECVYTLFPNSTSEKVAKFAERMKSDAPPYTILQKGGEAHVLRDHDSQTTGYLIFDPAWNPQFDTPLLKVNRPCSVTLRDAEDGTMKLSVASTDMDEWPYWCAPPGRIVLSGDVILTLKGRWDVEDVQAVTPRRCRTSRENGTTILRIPYKDFQPVTLTLTPVKSWWRRLFE